MVLYCFYVGCFLAATLFPQFEKVIAFTGAALGGIGAGFLWIAQGNYFTEASKRLAIDLGQDISKSTSYLAGIFGFMYLSFEVLLRISSSILIKFIDWRKIFTIYTCVACVTTFGMNFVANYLTESNTNPSISSFRKATATVQLLANDSKMKYMIGMNAIFGFSAAFLNSYVNGEVVAFVFKDSDSRYVGILSSWTAVAAALTSLLTVITSNKGVLLIGGALSFSLVAFSFLLFPSGAMWNIWGLVLVYTFQGVGRATFESTLKATFADYFAGDSTGAFGNIILQNGLASAIGYVLTFRLLCNQQSKYCIEYSDGSLHDVLTFEMIICVTGVLAILGYWRASVIHIQEQSQQEVIPQSEDDEEAEARNEEECDS